jgi:LPPG:FO 2-phospho-L-lactate transferase
MLKTASPQYTERSPSKVVAICGGVGGAKLANGLYNVLAPNTLSVVINTGDDFEHLGLHISPDIDTVTYTLAGLSNLKLGWGRADETWNFMQTLDTLGGDDWFSLGDRDLALHLERTKRMGLGQSLSQITGDFASALGISANLMPMSDDRVRTRVQTEGGCLDFQEYFVRLKCQPKVQRILFEGANTAKPNRKLQDRLNDRNLRAVFICPSNPFLSVDPILAIPGIKDALSKCSVPVIAVSPLIDNQAVKGPTAKIMSELSLPSTALSIAEHYAGLIDGFVIDDSDRAQADGIELPTLVTQILMKNKADQKQLGEDILGFADRLTKEDVEKFLPEQMQ